MTVLSFVTSLVHLKFNFNWNANRQLSYSINAYATKAFLNSATQNPLAHSRSFSRARGSHAVGRTEARLQPSLFRSRQRLRHTLPLPYIYITGYGTATLWWAWRSVRVLRWRCRLAGTRLRRQRLRIRLPQRFNICSCTMAKIHN